MRLQQFSFSLVSLRFVQMSQIQFRFDDLVVVQIESQQLVVVYMRQQQFRLDQCTAPKTKRLASSSLDWMIEQQCRLCELVVDQIRLICGSFRLDWLVAVQISSQEFRSDELVVDQIRLDQIRLVSQLVMVQIRLVFGSFRLELVVVQIG